MSESSLDASKGFKLVRRNAEELIKRGLGEISGSILASVSSSRGWGFIDRSGAFAIEPRFEWAASFSNRRACFSYSRAAYYWNFISYSYLHCMGEKDHLRFEFLYGQCPDESKPNDVFGYLDPSCTEVIAPQFCCAEPFRHGIARVATKPSEGVGFIGVHGDFRIEPQFDEATDFQNGFAIVGLKEKYGFLNLAGTLVVPLQFDYIWNFSEGLARFRIAERVGFINSAGAVMIEPTFTLAGDFSEGLAPVQLDGDWGFVSQNGKLSIKPQFAFASEFSNGSAEVEDYESSEPYLIDHTGNKVGSKLDECSTRTNTAQLTPVCSSGMWGFSNSQGDVVIPTMFHSVADFSNGLARVSNEENLWGYVDTSGRIAVPIQFYDCRDFLAVDKTNS